MTMDRNQENAFQCMANMLTQTLPGKEILKLAIYFDSFWKVFLSMYNNQKNVLSHCLPHLIFCKGTEIFFRNETLHIKLTNDKRLFTASVCEFRWWLDRSQTWPPLLGVPIPNLSRASSYSFEGIIVIHPVPKIVVGASFTTVKPNIKPVAVPVVVKWNGIHNSKCFIDVWDVVC